MNNNSQAGCSFCRNNQLLVGDPIAQNERAYLVQNTRFAGSYLIIPNDHVESPIDLADIWWQDVKDLLAKVPVKLIDYNLSFNIGPKAGQSVRHLHLWVTPRNDDLPADGKGLNALIEAYNHSVTL